MIKLKYAILATVGGVPVGKPILKRNKTDTDEAAEAFAIGTEVKVLKKAGVLVAARGADETKLTWDEKLIEED